MSRLLLVLLSLLLSPSLAAQGAPLIDRTEVSNIAYLDFMRAHPERRAPKYWGEYRNDLFRNSVAAELAPFGRDTFSRPDHPVVGVSWFDACDYCQWRGQRLPTHAEWMAAAGGADGRLWPWGDQWDYRRANSGGERHGEYDGYTYSAPVLSFPAGRAPSGALNMAGNVAEWVAEQLVAGGSSNSSPSGVAIKSAQPREPAYRSFDIGFRCIAR
ncbi:MAG: formylglycine-generating enzyme family protein [Gammaproteobacteria bacterium]|nr:formylglycine-generating enzyme family protein [Gammaproteobacteria bacterium]